MRNETLNNGFDAASRKQDAIKITGIGIIAVSVVLNLVLFACIVSIKSESDNWKRKYNEEREVRSINESTINELTYDNNQLILRPRRK